jgi:hypothetical protein
MRSQSRSMLLESGAGRGINEPTPGGHIPSDVPPPPRHDPDEPPDQGPTGPRTPDPIEDPGINDPRGPGSEPDYLPGGPSNPMPRFWPAEPETK